MNVTAMRQVGEYILAEPRRFNMRAVWLEAIGLDVSKYYLHSLHHSKDAIPPCGTVACFAGEWAIINKLAPIDYSAIANLCRQSLDLPNDDLFFMDSWPARLRTRLLAGTRRYAEHFVNVVMEDYIATNGWET